MKDFNKNIALAAAILAALTIAIGAFGAHGLKSMVDAESLVSFETGVRYQMYHVLALFVLAFARGLPEKVEIQTARLFILGMVCFSGSIYLLSLDEALGFDATSVAFITPFGGLLLIVGWIRLAVGIWKIR